MLGDKHSAESIKSAIEKYKTDIAPGRFKPVLQVSTDNKIDLKDWEQSQCSVAVDDFTEELARFKEWEDKKDWLSSYFHKGLWNRASESQR